MLIKKKKKKYYKKIKTLSLVLKYSKNPMKKDGTFFFQNQPCIISKILNFRKKIEDILIILIIIIILKILMKWDLNNYL
jgi:hypothetical protein